MSSASRLEVTLSQSARDFLESLDARRQSNLALSLTTFYKTSSPQGSRALAPDGKISDTDRIWIAGEFEIVYRASGRKVEIGIIRPA